MNLHLWGTDFRRSDSQLRQKLYLPLEERENVIGDLLKLGFRDLIYVQTCNRVEFYTTAESYYSDTRNLWRKTLAYFGLDEEVFYRGYHFEGKSALRHLLRVSSSLESLVVGEPQILGQLKEAYKWTEKKGFPLDPSLKQVFHLAFETAKKIRSLTAIGEGTVSVASLGIRRLQSMESHYPLKKAVVVGRGPINIFIVQWLKKNRPTCPVLWVNRNLERLKIFSDHFEVETQSLDDFLKEPVSFSHLFTATSSTQPIFSSDFFRKFETKPKLVFDFAEPPDVSASSQWTELITVIRLEDLIEQAKENRMLRMQSVKSAEGMIEDALKEYFLRLKQTPVLKGFSEVESKIVEDLEDAVEKLKEDFSQEHQVKIKKWGEKLVRKNLHHSRAHLRSILGNATRSARQVT